MRVWIAYTNNGTILHCEVEREDMEEWIDTQEMLSEDNIELANVNVHGANQ